MKFKRNKLKFTKMMEEKAFRFFFQFFEFRLLASKLVDFHFDILKLAP